MVIPSRLRQKVGIKEGTTSEFYERTFGIVKEGGLTKALEESRRKEKEHEDHNIKH